MEHGLINLLKNHKYKRTFNQGVLAKPVFDQPYWVHHQAAIWLFRLHRRCVLCQLHHLDYQISRMNFICSDCYENIATQVSHFNIHLNIGKDFPTNKDGSTAQQTTKRQHIRAYPISYYQYPVNQLIKKFKDHENGKRHQRGLTRHERLVNTQTDFYLCQQIPNRQIIVFDDVITTGATVAAVANLLIQSRHDIRLIAICMAHGSADFGFDAHDR